MTKLEANWLGIYGHIGADKYEVWYALCEIVYSRHGTLARAPVTDRSIYAALKNAILETHGDLGFASLKSSLNVKYANPDTNMLIIRGDRKHFDILTSSMVFVNKLDQYEAFLSTLHVAGSIRSCLKFIINFHKKNMPQLYPSCVTEEQRADVMRSIMEACDDIKIEGMRQTTKKEHVVSALEMIIDSEKLS